VARDYSVLYPPTRAISLGEPRHPPRQPIRCRGGGRSELPRPREGIRITRSGCVSSLYTAILAKYREQMPKYYYDPTKYAIYPDQLGIKYSTERTDAKRPQQQS
jgi:hypothetical protein